MATKFLEPGGDADFLVGTTNGFWRTISGSVAVATDFVHGGHQKSIKFISTTPSAFSPFGVLADAGTRISFYVYIVALPSATETPFLARTSGDTANVFSIRITSAGILQLWNGVSAQIGTNGATLSTGQWYRISLAYTITSTTVNRFELFVNAVSSISITNATITTIGSNCFRLGDVGGNATLDFRSSDHYIDNSSSLTDPGNIWVTAKRPVSNGTTNGFTTQIGSGGSGYGSGHSPQVNERPLSTTNGWSMIGAGAAVTEAYNIEGASVGDINITGATIRDMVGWVSASSLVGETASVYVTGFGGFGGHTVSLTSTPTLFTIVTGNSSYASGTGFDIGLQTDTSLTTVSLYECGILVAFIPPTGFGVISPFPTFNPDGRFSM